MAYPPAGPLLLTRRLSSFLHATVESLREQNDAPTDDPTAPLPQPSAVIQTALLATSTGKLLAYESPLPVRTLRTHCSVAASLWAMHSASASSVPVALNQRPQANDASNPQEPSGPTQAQGQSQQGQPTRQTLQTQQESYFQSTQPPQQTPENTSPTGLENEGGAPVSIAASFNGGAVFVIRRLQCGLLFACSTPAPTSSASTRPSTPAEVGSLAPATVTGPEAAPSGLPAEAITTPSSLLPHATMPIIPGPRPAAQGGPTPPTIKEATDESPTDEVVAEEPSSGGAAPTGTPVSKDPAESHPDGELVGSLIPGSSALAENLDTEEATNSGSKEPAAGARVNHLPVLETLAIADDAASVRSSTTVGGAPSGGARSRKGGSVAATIAIARQQVDELAQLLDSKLGSLLVPEDTIGINGFC